VFILFLLFCLLLTTAAGANPPKKDVVKWLDAPDPSRTHNRLLEEHHEGTGEWFLKSEEFETWLETLAGTLWIRGMRTHPLLILSNKLVPELFFCPAGNGKSVLWYVTPREGFSDISYIVI
jgi:hypothetical protein